MSSDDFFKNKKKFIKSFSPNIIFIDGLHTFQQSLNDVINSLNILNPGGYIIMHDCNPPTRASAIHAYSVDEAKIKWHKNNTDGWTDEWCGDAWKTILYLKNNFNDLKINVVDTDYGLGIIRKSNHLKTDHHLIENIDSYEKIDYSYLENNRKEMLNLITINEVLKLINKN
jgi:hypothetical protein